jgi:hypothetical protein
MVYTLFQAENLRTIYAYWQPPQSLQWLRVTDRYEHSAAFHTSCTE